MEKDLHGWKMPMITKSKVYQNKFLNFFGDHSTRTLDHTLPLTNQSITLKLLRSPEFKKLFEAKEASKKYLHIGLVQIGVKPLTRQTPKSSVVLCLRDARHLNFQNSLLAMVRSSLSDGPIYFNCFANIMVPLVDEGKEHVLTVELKSDLNGGGVISGVRNVVLSFRVYYRVIAKPFEDNALKESPLGITTFFQSNVKSNSIVKKEIKWDEIEIPAEWLEKETNQK